MQLPALPNLTGVDKPIREALETLWRAVQASSAQVVPGTIMFSAEQPNKIKDPWLVCDGRSVSRVTYKPLFDRIGTHFGAGDGETTFGLPNLGGRAIFGYGFGLRAPAGEQIVSGYMTIYELDPGATVIPIAYLTPIILGR